jgi:hypothetical protein
MTEQTFSVGYAQRTITPDLDGERPVYLAGFGRNRVAQSVHDDLYVRALALRLGGTSLALAALDLIGLGRSHCQEIEERVDEHSPGTPVVLASTHTHHGPDTIGLWGPDMVTSGVDLHYLAGTKDRIVDTVLEALDQVQPAWMCSVAVRVPGVAKNARDPQILDDELLCVQFWQPESRMVLVTMVDFACHPEVLWDENAHITSDYPGYLRRQVEIETGGPCLFFAGALGGMMTPDVQDHTFDEAEEIGGTLAQAALDALAGSEPGPIGQLDHRRCAFAIPMANPVFQMAAEAGLLPDVLREDGAVDTEASLVRIGSVWLAGVPGELLPKLGLALKTEMQQAGAGVAGIIGLANDELGYILPHDKYVYPDDPFQPDDHYEETMSIGPEAGPNLLRAVRSLLANQ